MTDVVIAGIGQTQVGEHWELSIRELAYNAIEAAIADAQGLRPQALFVGNMLAPLTSHQAHLGALLADFAGLDGIEAYSIEAAGASGGAALRMGYLAIKSGLVESALVVGVEKFTDQIGATAEASISTAADSDYESVQGMTPNAQAALVMRRYLYEYDIPRGALAGFPLLAHAHGVANPFAMFRKAIRPELYDRAAIVSDPLNMFDVAPLADGAAAVLLTRRKYIPSDFGHPLVCITGSSLVTDALALHDRPDPLDFVAARLSVERACRMAGIMPMDVDFFELNDSYSVYAALSLEAAGFAARGEGWKLAENGYLALNGELPSLTMGGLKARGNPGGATGVYQAVEAALQLRGQAGDNQVINARRGLIQTLGGPASTAVSHVIQVMS